MAGGKSNGYKISGLMSHLKSSCVKTVRKATREDRSKREHRARRVQKKKEVHSSDDDELRRFRKKKKRKKIASRTQLEQKIALSDESTTSDDLSCEDNKSCDSSPDAAAFFQHVIDLLEIAGEKRKKKAKNQRSMMRVNVIL